MRGPDGVFAATVPGIGEGARYGLRADGPHDPERGLRFDPSKLLVDPYAVALDRSFAWNPALSAPRNANLDSAPFVPKAVITSLPPPKAPAASCFRPGGLIYEVQVRAFTRRHPDVPEKLRGTVAALAHPAILEHLTRLGVDAVELMPVAAWIDEHHLQRRDGGQDVRRELPYPRPLGTRRNGRGVRSGR
jgi:glycogen operon protein